MKMLNRKLNSILLFEKIKIYSTSFTEVQLQFRDQKKVHDNISRQANI